MERLPKLNPELITVVGETASGKSALAHEIAKKYHGEVIAADSRTVYKGMDIGTAKPSNKEQDEVPYHLLDIKEPDETYSAADFQTDANRILEQISSRGNIALLTGGTGLFIDSILFDFEFGEAPDSGLRAELAALSDDELRTRALKIDENLDSNMLSNRRHLIRLIETGKIVNHHKKLRENTLVIGLSLPRNELRKRIEQRTETMFKRGLRKEVNELQSQYGWGLESMTGIGYREFKPYYDGEISMGEVKKSIVKNTLKYAKRQRTWFKRNPYIEWFENPENAQKTVKTFIEQG